MRRQLAAERMKRGEALRAAARTEIETLPPDWQRAQFVIEVERGSGEPVISIRFYEIEGDSFEQSGGEC